MSEQRGTTLGNVKALVFDVFGTVVDWRGSVINEGQRLGRAKGWSSVNWQRFADEWRIEGYINPIGEMQRGERSWMPVDEMHRAMLDILLKRHAIAGLSEAEIADFNRVWHRLIPWPDSVPGLNRLRTRFILGPLSNGDFGLLTRMAKNAGLPWDCILSAELFGAFKPNPAVYNGAVRLLGLQPEEVMLVAAHSGDLKAARACGHRTAFVGRPIEYGPHNNREPAPDPTFDVIANDFMDLAGRLGV